jgi:hypothetical protein
MENVYAVALSNAPVIVSGEVVPETESEIEGEDVAV